MAKLSAILLLTAVFLLAGLGLVMLASTSYFAEEGGGEDYFTFWKQVRFLGIGACLCGFLAFWDYNHLLRWWWQILAVAAVVLALIYVPGLGIRINGATRWLGFGSFRMQPSEFAKIALVIGLAAWFARNETGTRTFLRGFLLPAWVLGVFVLLIGAEVDLGNALIAAAAGAGIMFTAGTRLAYLLFGAVSVFGALGYAVMNLPNRFERILACYRLAEYKDTWGLQQWVSLLAFGSGGVSGAGIGQGRMKLSYLPEAHTDFIFPMVGEELGLCGTAGTVLMFVFIAIAGMCAACYAPNRFGKLLGFGLTFLLCLEALLNMGVTTALLPNKGLPLPFVSYGGSSLIAAMIAIGILINIHRQGVHLTRDQLPGIRKTYRWTPQL